MFAVFCVYLQVCRRICGSRQPRECVWVVSLHDTEGTFADCRVYPPISVHVWGALWSDCAHVNRTCCRNVAIHAFVFYSQVSFLPLQREGECVVSWVCMNHSVQTRFSLYVCIQNWNSEEKIHSRGAAITGGTGSVCRALGGVGGLDERDAKSSKCRCRYRRNTEGIHGERGGRVEKGKICGLKPQAVSDIVPSLTTPVIVYIM